MLFNSIEFLLFLPVVVLLYYALPHRYRWGLLLAASYYFYAAWKLEYLVLIIASTLIDYYAGLRMGAEEHQRKRRKFLYLSLAGNLGMLLGFKYFNFFSDSVRVALEQFNIFADTPHLEFLLPVGISFYTFQSMSYTIDLYRGERDVERHLGIFALYVAFFPQLVAGPIERSTHLLPQFRERVTFDYGRTTSGLRLILWGFFKKIVIADQLALFVQQVYGSPGEWSGPAVLLASYFFAFQIFCDFSAYTDIARGSARIMGFDLMENFNRPYFSRSIREFWARWHISLSTWFRDYLYIPLGGNRVVKWRWYYNLMVVFVVSGLWHGANWTFVAWGFLHGAYLVLGIVTQDWRDGAWALIGRGTARLRSRIGLGWRAAPQLATAVPGGGAPSVEDSAPALTSTAGGDTDVGLTTLGGDAQQRAPDWPRRWAGWFSGFQLREAVAIVFTFHLVVFAWIFFRARSISEAFIIIGSLGDWSAGFQQLASSFEKFDFAPALFALLIMEVVHAMQERSGRGIIHKRLLGMPGWLRWLIYYALIMYILLFGQYATAQQFIYFQF